MPAARETLLEAAGAALAARPWPAVRMVDVAAAAGVSRQTLYNEFGGKHGLGRALVRRECARYLEGVERALTVPGRTVERLAAVAEWTVRAARAYPLVRALLTGFWDPDLPAAGRAPGPGELARTVRDRAAAVLMPAADAERCELAVRLALSYVVAPGEEPGAGELLRLLSAQNRRAGAR
ncbi:TetR/AcrR family transcriptional regulator [Streptomyces sp. NBC_00190]|uniref:TetR/AcrR family transcriptional regulator n=1 Tax=unclassified Streptomyces TaxID=2593676 RepID=UPI002E2B770C|nr:TetR/AcrR family transcriptional regulator [Streptomyces sp. NBC_00190]WSZ42321.1 TetR/AcrR family transcriptional regulator [Streptomyces sp. NBC_00868]